MFFTLHRPYGVMLLLLYMATGALFAQSPSCEHRLSGRVLDADTRLPLSGARLVVRPGNDTLFTDGHGFFRSGKYCEGTYTLFVDRAGFSDSVLTVSLRRSVSLAVSLEHAAIRLHDVEVVGHQHAVRSTATATRIDGAAIRENRGGDLADILTQVSGVGKLQNGDNLAKPVINGLYGNRILILNNGIRQEGQQWGNDHAPEIDPFGAKSITVIKGAEGLRYGADALGGVILVDPAALPVDPTLSGEVHLTGNSNGRGMHGAALLSGGIGGLPGFGWRIQGTSRYSGNQRTADYYQDNTGTRALNVSAAVGYQRQAEQYQLYFSRFSNTLGILRSSHIGDSSDLAGRIVRGRPYPSEDRGFSYGIGVPRQEVTHDLMKLSYHRDLDHGGNIDLQYGFQRNHRKEFDLRRAGRSAIPVLDMLLTTQTLDGVYEHTTHTDRQRQLGISGMLQVNNNVPGTFSTPLIPNFDSYAAGVFALERVVKSHFEAEAGVRYDYKQFSSAGFDREGKWYGGDRDFHNLSASAGAFWQATGTFGLRSNIGLAWRAPAANELYSNSVHNALARYERGDERLLSEKGIKWVSSAELKSGRLNVSIDGYVHYVNGYIFSVPSGDIWQSIAGVFPIWEYQQTDALLSGVDVDARLSFGHWQYGMKASLIRARDISAHTYLPLIPADRLEQQVRWQPEAAGLLRNPYIQINHVLQARQYRFDATLELAAPPAGYQLVDIKGGSDLTIDGQTISLHLGVSNLLNNLYKDYMNLFRYYTHAAGRNVVIGLSHTF